MEYTIKSHVRHGICWNGGVREFTGEINIELSSDEVEQIKSIHSEVENEGCEVIAKEFPETYSKIRSALTDFLEYSLIVNLRITGEWQEGNDEIDEHKLMIEDIESGKFIPLYMNEGEPDNLIECEWCLWEIRQLQNLPYRQRTEYLVKRYHIETDGIEDYDYDFDFELPEIK